MQSMLLVSIDTVVAFHCADLAQKPKDICSKDGCPSHPFRDIRNTVCAVSCDRFRIVPLIISIEIPKVALNLTVMPANFLLQWQSVASPSENEI